MCRISCILVCYWAFVLYLCSCNFVNSVVQVDRSAPNEEDIASQIGTMKNTIKILSDQWEKWNTLFITSLEPRITSTASTLSSIDSNIHNLQERAHVWDTFQLHVAAWNDQLASMDRKIDILNKAIEQLTILDNKMNTILSDEYKLDKLIKMTNSLTDAVLNIENSMISKHYCKSSKDSSLFEEFAARGILSSLKLIERKVDQLLSTRQSDNLAKSANDEQIIVKYKSTENLINDIASKVDIIFDSVSKANNENDYSDEYIDLKDTEGSGSSTATSTNNAQKTHKHIMTHQANAIIHRSLLDQKIKEVNDKVSNIDINVLSLLSYNQMLQTALEGTSKSIISRNDLISMLKRFSQNISINQTGNMNLILASYFHEDRAHWSAMLNTLSQKCLAAPVTPTASPKHVEEPTTTPFLLDISTTENNVYSSSNNQYDAKTEYFFEESSTLPSKSVNKSSCSDLDQDSPSGIYIFKSGAGDFVTERFFNKHFCEMRDNGLWTVIQRRDNYSIQQDFNVSWHDYKLGFGDLQKEFWIGNNYLSRLSNDNNLTLRIELHDFDGNSAWAEYKTFKVAGEHQQFTLTVRGYSGNASDAFSSHSGSPFSTYDEKNDYAPECCPCSVSYGGGWWFNRCFESNLNGVYYKKPFENDYFRGIIWEHWLGNYSLKKSLMMVKYTGSTQFYSSSNNATKIEDP